MSVVSEVYVAEVWLRTVLAATAALDVPIGDRIYSHIAPKDTVRPYIIFRQLAATDLRGIGASRIWSNLDYNVFGVAEGGSWGALAGVAHHIDVALHGKSGTAAGGSIISCERHAPYSLPEIVAGVQFRSLGGRYRLKVQRG